MSRHEAAPPASRTVTVIGSGGNIGSHLVPHLGRMRRVGRIVLIDPDRYETGNLPFQNLERSDIGRSKCRAQARRLARARPDLEVLPFATAVEAVPVGRLRSDLILACLDSRRARMYVNQIARHLGIPWIDAGVQGEMGLARVSIWPVGSNAACMECAWDARDYAVVEQEYSCRGEVGRPVATGASSALGALAAALQALAVEDLLAGSGADEGAARQTVLDAAHHRIHVTGFKRNPDCRLADHSVWRIARLDRSPSELTLAEALELAPDLRGPRSLGVEASPFVTRLSCACGAGRRLLRLEAALRPAHLGCRRCGRRLVATGLDRLPRLDAGPAVPASVRAFPLSRIGIRGGDVISLRGPDGERHFELAAR